MANFSETGPRYPVIESIRVDKVSPGSRTGHTIRALGRLVLAMVGLIPIFMMIMTAFKTRADIVTTPPKLFFQPSLEGFVYLLTDRAVVSKGRMEKLKRRPSQAKLGWMDQIALQERAEDQRPQRICSAP